MARICWSDRPARLSAVLRIARACECGLGFDCVGVACSVDVRASCFLDLDLCRNWGTDEDVGEAREVII
jgi:hypothetical protein